MLKKKSLSRCLDRAVVRTSEKEPKETDAGKRRGEWGREGEDRQTGSRKGAVTREDEARKTRADKEGGGRGC